MGVRQVGAATFHRVPTQRSTLQAMKYNTNIKLTKCSKAYGNALYYVVGRSTTERPNATLSKVALLITNYCATQSPS